MTTQLHANTVVVDNSNEEFILVGFADERDGGCRDALMFQRAWNFDEQDIATGMDKVYIERDDQSRGGYGGILGLELRRNGMMVRLDPPMARRLGDNEFEIHFDLDEVRFAELREGLRAVFRGFNCLEEAAS